MFGEPVKSQTTRKIDGGYSDLQRYPKGGISSGSSTPHRKTDKQFGDRLHPLNRQCIESKQVRPGAAAYNVLA
jgi:hypothetical protein